LFMPKLPATPLPPLPAFKLQDALDGLCGNVVVQSGGHVKPIHSHVANRLVLEGGFRPEWSWPGPPLESKQITLERFTLSHRAEAARSGELEIVGGMRCKDVDVTIASPSTGPVVGVSIKTTGNAFRNLTNRAEEAPGDAANLHMMYPGFVFGFLHFIKYAELGSVAKEDASFDREGNPLRWIVRFHNMLVALLGRAYIYDPMMKFESVGLLIYKNDAGKGTLLRNYPPPTSPLHYSHFYNRLYATYDIRFGTRKDDGKVGRKHWVLKGHSIPEELDGEAGFGWSVRTGPSELPAVPPLPESIGG
jgi:hypothetical protein